MTKKLIIIIVTTLCFVFTSCKEDKAPVTAPAPITKRKVPAFNASNAYANIEAQLAFGTRVPGSEGHAKVINWIESELKSHNAKVIKQDFKASFYDKKNVPCTNIIGQLNPDAPKRILLAAHFDSRIVADKDDERKEEPIPGADDGGSGVAVLLEIARLVNENGIDIGVDFIFFDAEDQGQPGPNGDPASWAIGSQYWAKNIVPSGYKAKFGILLDMVGSDKATFGKEEYSTRFAPLEQKKIWELAKNMGYSDFFRDEVYGPVYDDHIAVNRDAGIKMVDIINQSPDDRSSFGHYHHTHDDNIDVISKRTLQVVGQVVTSVLYNESNGTF